MGDGERTAAEYDAFASHYAAHNETSAHNAYYERPATIALLGDVTGADVLEIGCGAGPLTEWLVEHDAQVTALEVSQEMLHLAQERLGQRATFVHADAARPLTFAADRSFDVVVASLVLQYIEHWEPVLAEFRRVLRSDGRVIFSTHHPGVDWEHTPDNYFETALVTETWTAGGHPYDVSFWRRPLTAMTTAIQNAGFVIEALVEPQPDPALEAINPSRFKRLSTTPTFLFFCLRAG